MKKIFIILLAFISFVGCADFLDTENLYDKNTDNYYKSPKDIEEAFAGAYSSLYTSGQPTSDELLFTNLLSDVVLGGGGAGDVAFQDIDAFKDPVEDTYKTLWLSTYEGVFRCNSIIEAVSNNDFSSSFASADAAEAFKKQSLGEAYFLRGFYLFRAAKLFGGLPLIITSSTDRKSPRSSFSETFTQILSDFKMGIDNMQSTPANAIASSEYGRANKWIAQGFMARAFLFFTGYMTNIEKQATTSATLPDGTVIGSAEIEAYLNDCITNSKYKMLPDFRNLWAYAHVNERAKIEQDITPLPWAETEGLKWAGQDGFTTSQGTGNSEVMFSLRHASGIGWGTTWKISNRAVLFMSIRGNGNDMLPFGEGWGLCTVHSGFVNNWDDADVRKAGSVLELNSAEQGTGAYDDKDDQHHSTGFYNKKYSSLVHEDASGGTILGMFANMYDVTSSDFQRWHAQDFIYMRFSDILLMHSEITKTAAKMNLVRGRAGLADVAWSLDALKEERLREFAFEGLRWFDLVRWGDVSGSKNYFTKQIDVVNSGLDAKYSIEYRDEIKGLMPIPESEIRLSAGVYEQNPGW